MKTNELIHDFLIGETKGKASNLRIEGDKLINWETTIAQRIDGVVTINVTHYSMTTTKHQNLLRRECPNAPTVDNVRQGAYDLKQYLPKATEHVAS